LLRSHFDRRISSLEHDIPQGGTGIGHLNHKEIVMVRKFIPTSLVLLSLSMGTAFAGPTVLYADLNIAKPADASVLTERVHTAATAYCAPSYETRHLIAPAFAPAASTACIKQISQVVLEEIQAMKSSSTQMAALQQ
jgi:UrcA family protein